MIIGQDNVIKRAYEEPDRFYWKEEEFLAYEDTLKKDEGIADGRHDAFVEVAQNI